MNEIRLDGKLIMKYIKIFRNLSVFNQFFLLKLFPLLTEKLPRIIIISSLHPPLAKKSFLS